jgi:hypothetical protein
MAWPLVTVAETSSYLAWAAGVLTEEERFEVERILEARGLS